MSVELYTRPSCPRCVEMKSALSDSGIQFSERVVDSDLPASYVQAKFPDQRMLPILAVGDHVIGGVEELRAIIAADQLQYLIT